MLVASPEPCSRSKSHTRNQPHRAGPSRAGQKLAKRHGAHAPHARAPPPRSGASSGSMPPSTVRLGISFEKALSPAFAKLHTLPFQCCSPISRSTFATSHAISHSLNLLPSFFTES